ncbi:hypothetical protein F503_04226 [Ophiostoma piceae UAMH 11346]|uniref:Uncharacterized protein n=1 Tax=Ophiostoma piceae (strain UAMH 11346) TaxID=1262450 RepID=S3C563_OPHP1|nr:hypothetical protein F503_04226 [Ophiostoma piceae UAMH 11346]
MENEKHTDTHTTAMTRERTPDGRRASRSDTGLSSGLYASNGSPAIRRRSSNFSDYSQDARDLLNPRPLTQRHSYSHSFSGESMRHNQPTSSWDSLPLAFALLPAVGGLLVQGGSSFVTDLMLLCLGGIFLHWSVTQPWTWYHSAQQIREEHEASTADVAVHSDDEEEDARTPSPALKDVEEENGTGPNEGKELKAEELKEPKEPESKGISSQRARRQQERRSFRALQESALRELYRHEIMALLSCFACPVLGAYLLHALRDQLTRPSEGLISNFNLTVFIMGAEVRPLRHLLQLVQARTLHLQRIVHANPYRDEEEQYRARREQEETEQNQTLSDLVHRLDCLEESSTSLASLSPDKEAAKRDSKRDLKRERETLLWEVRAQMQPELDALARALRRTHKQQTLLENQVASRFRTTDQRLNDAVSIVTARQRPSFAAVVWLYIVSSWVAVQWVFESLVTLLLYVPRRLAGCAAAVVTLPVTAVQTAVSKDTKEAANGRKLMDTAPSIIGGTIRSKKAVEAEYDYDYDYTRRRA